MQDWSMKTTSTPYNLFIVTLSQEWWPVKAKEASG